MGTDSHTAAAARTAPIKRGTGPVRTAAKRPAGGSAAQRRPTGPPRPPKAEPKPRLRQIGIVCAWAALLGFVGLILAVYAFVRLIGSDAPAWYEPTVLITGGAGVALTVAAFLNVRRRIIPWALLSLATVTMGGAFVMTTVAL